MAIDEQRKLSPQAIWNLAYDDATECLKVCDVGGGAAALRDIEIKRLCDDNGFFLRHFIYASDGTISSITDTDVAGTLYTPVGTVKICDETEIQTRCFKDSNDVKFLRNYVFDEFTGNLLSVSDMDMGGSPFTPVAPIIECPPETQKFNLLSCEQINVNDASTSSLTVPVGASFAKIQVKGGSIAFSVDGGSPTNSASIGYQLDPCGVVKVGEGDSDNAGDVQELFDFEAIALSGETATLEVCYWELR